MIRLCLKVLKILVKEGIKDAVRMTNSVIVINTITLEEGTEWDGNNRNMHSGNKEDGYTC